MKERSNIVVPLTDFCGGIVDSSVKGETIVVSSSLQSIVDRAPSSSTVDVLLVMEDVSGVAVLCCTAVLPLVLAKEDTNVVETCPSDASVDNGMVTTSVIEGEEVIGKSVLEDA